MIAVDPMARKLAVHYRCSSCSRCFVGLGSPRAERTLCACGAPLSLGPLPGGIHELRSALPDDARATIPTPEGPVSVTFGKERPPLLEAR